MPQEPDDYEAREGYRLEFPEPSLAIAKNRSVRNSPYSRMMFEREARVLELLREDGLIR